MKCFSGANFPVAMNLFLYASIARATSSPRSRVGVCCNVQ